jgi:hypothetical protein
MLWVMEIIRFPGPFMKDSDVIEKTMSAVFGWKAVEWLISSIIGEMSIF